jgi:HK97 family phage major capsid protein
MNAILPSSMTALIARRAKLRDQMRALQDEADAGDGEGVMTEAQQSAFDTLKQALDALEKAITNRAAIDDIDRQTRGALIGGGRSTNAETQWESRQRDFNICRAIAGAAGLHVDDGPEREISRELAKRSGRAVEGFMIPMHALHKRLEKRILTPTGAAAGLIGTYLDETQYIDALRAQIICARLGARYITGLDTQIDLPALTATATAMWVADGSGITTDTTETFGKVSLRPHHLGGIVEFTRATLLTSTPDVQDAARNDLVQVLARGIDLAALAGTGSPQPTGILNQSGLTVVPLGTNGAALTWAGVLALMETVQLANAPTDGLGFAGNPRVRAALMNTLKFPGTNGSMPVMDDPDRLAGYPFASTTQMPSNGTKGTGTNLSSLIYGAWSDVLIAMWGGGVEVLVNPYGATQFASGNVQVRVMVTADVALRHVASFAAITDIVAA